MSEQHKELDELRQRLVDLSSEHEEERATMSTEIARLVEQVAQLESQAKTANSKKEEAEKEQEDLLVLLEELSTKRKGDKAKMKEAGMDVSEDEDEDGDDEDDEDDKSNKGKDAQEEGESS